LAGRYAAVTWEVQQRDRTSSAAVVFDVVARKRVRARYTPQQIDWSYWFSDVEVTSHGGLGVIEVSHQDTPYPSQSAYTVRKRDAHGTATLDSGTDVDPRSLALSNGTLYWTRSGVAHSAPLY
jgi:hypothetical protein